MIAACLSEWSRWCWLLRSLGLRSDSAQPQPPHVGTFDGMDLSHGPDDAAFYHFHGPSPFALVLFHHGPGP